MKKRFLLLLTLSILSVPIQSLAQNDIYDKEIICEDNIMSVDLKENPLLRGTKPPTGTSYLNLASNTYNYNVDFIYNIYTNSLFSGSSTMTVKVGSITVIKNGMNNESKGINVYVYDSSGKEVGKKAVGLSGGTVKFSLNSSTKYYVRFVKQDDTQTYKFSGTISK